jgi:hypothetical protein
MPQGAAALRKRKMVGREEYLIPKLAQHDYDAFRRLINTGLPGSYNEWLKLMEQARLENEGRQFIVRAIEINSHEFARYCWAKRCAFDITTLENFTTEKASGNRY